MQAFCPFAALNIERQEIRHSALLAWSLNPAEAHGWGADFLANFLRAAQPRLNLADFNFRDAWAQREWRNIDVVIEIPRHMAEPLVVAIEMKVGASQGADQLKRYRERIEAHWPNAQRLYLFLRQKDEEPNDDSWKPIDFATISDALRLFWEAPPRGDLGALQLLSAYRNLLNRKFVMNNSLEKLAHSLWREHATALKFLTDNQPNQKWYGLMDFLVDENARMQDGSDMNPGNWLASSMSPFGKGLSLLDRRGALIRFAFNDMRPLLGFNTGRTQWSDGRIMMVELFVRTESIDLKLMLGPSADGSQLLRSRVKDVFGNTSKSQEYTLLAGARVAKWDDNKEIEVTELVKKIARVGKNLLESALPEDRWNQLLSVLMIDPANP